MDLSEHDYRSLAEFRYQLRRFLQFSEAQAKEHGLEPQQHQALLALQGLPVGSRPAIAELARRLVLRHHSAVELTDRLEAAGLVKRHPDPEDGRQTLVSLTALGRAKLRSLSIAHQEELRVGGPALARALRDVLKAQKESSAA
jgi:DNA-binding MarR family transcriptional regulator